MKAPGVSSLGSIASLRCDVSGGDFRDVSPTGTWANPWPATTAAIDATSAKRLRARSTDPIQFVESDQHVTRLRAVWRSEHARRVQLIDDACRATVADL